MDQRRASDLIRGMEIWHGGRLGRRMNGTLREVVGLALMCSSALCMCSCKREERAFAVPASATQLPEGVAYNNRVRPGPVTAPVSSTSQPTDHGQLAHEIFGAQFASNAQALSDGQNLYEAFNCSGCHAHGAGGIGPPLLDGKWFYGAEPDQVYQSILQGRPNGMPSFRGRIPDFQMWQLVAYVRSMSGQANKQAAPGREDHMSTQPPPNSMEPQTPSTVPAPTTGPMGGKVGA